MTAATGYMFTHFCYRSITTTNTHSKVGDILMVGENLSKRWVFHMGVHNPSASWRLSHDYSHEGEYDINKVAPKNFIPGSVSG